MSIQYALACPWGHKPMFLLDEPCLVHCSRKDCAANGTYVSIKTWNTRENYSKRTAAKILKKARK